MQDFLRYGVTFSLIACRYNMRAAQQPITDVFERQFGNLTQL